MSIISEEEKKQNLINSIAFLTSTGDGSAKDSLIDFVAFARNKNRELLEGNALPSIEKVLQESLEKLDSLKDTFFEYEKEKDSYKVRKTSLFSGLFSSKFEYVEPDAKKNPEEYKGFRRAEDNRSYALNRYGNALHKYGDQLGQILRFSLLSPDVKTAIEDKIRSNEPYSSTDAIWEAYYQSKLIDSDQAMALLKKYTPNMSSHISEDVQSRFEKSYKESVSKPFDINGDEKNSLDKDYMAGLLSCMYAVNHKYEMPAYKIGPEFLKDIYRSDKNMAAYLEDIQYVVDCIIKEPDAFTLEQLNSIHNEILHDMQNLKKANFKVGSYWTEVNKLSHLSWADGAYKDNMSVSLSLRQTFDGVLQRHAVNKALAGFGAVLANEQITAGKSVHTSPAIIFKGQSLETVQGIVEDVKYTKALINARRPDVSFDLKPEGADTKLYVVYAADGDRVMPNMLLNAFNELTARKFSTQTPPVASNENEQNENNGFEADSLGM